MRDSLVEVLGTQTARNCLRQSVHDVVVACLHGWRVPRAHIETLLKCLNVSRAPSTPSLGHRFTKLSFLCRDCQEVQASLDGKTVLSIAKVMTVTQPVVGLGYTPERLGKPSLFRSIKPLPVVKVSPLLPKLLQVGLTEIPREVPCSNGDGGRHRIFVSPAMQTNLPVDDKISYVQPDGALISSAAFALTPDLTSQEAPLVLKAFNVPLPFLNGESQGVLRHATNQRVRRREHLHRLRDHQRPKIILLETPRRLRSFRRVAGAISEFFSFLGLMSPN